jgi:hypothetical protein
MDLVCSFFLTAHVLVVQVVHCFRLFNGDVFGHVTGRGGAGRDFLSAAWTSLEPWPLLRLPRRWSWGSALRRARTTISIACTMRVGGFRIGSDVRFWRGIGVVASDELRVLRGEGGATHVLRDELMVQIFFFFLFLLRNVSSLLLHSSHPMKFFKHGFFHSFVVVVVVRTFFFFCVVLVLVVVVTVVVVVLVGLFLPHYFPAKQTLHLLGRQFLLLCLLFQCPFFDALHTSQTVANSFCFRQINQCIGPHGIATARFTPAVLFSSPLVQRSLRRCGPEEMLLDRRRILLQFTLHQQQTPHPAPTAQHRRGKRMDQFRQFNETMGHMNVCHACSCHLTFQFGAVENGTEFSQGTCKGGVDNAFGGFRGQQHGAATAVDEVFHLLHFGRFVIGIAGVPLVPDCTCSGDGHPFCEQGSGDQIGFAAQFFLVVEMFHHTFARGKGATSEEMMKRVDFVDEVEDVVLVAIFRR